MNNIADYTGYTFVFDVDGTICPIKEAGEQYQDITPYPEIVQKLRFCHEHGARIILYTSRNMNSYNNNLGLINKNTAPVMLEWLKKWNIPYDEIYFGKVWPGHKGFYIDDRSVRPDEFLTHTAEELELICMRSRKVASEVKNE